MTCFRFVLTKPLFNPGPVGLFYIIQLAGEPSARETKIFAIKVDPLILESQNQAKNIPVGLDCIPPSKFEANCLLGS